MKEKNVYFNTLIQLKFMRIPIYFLDAATPDKLSTLDWSHRIIAVYVVTGIVIALILLMYANSQRMIPRTYYSLNVPLAVRIVNFWNSYSQLILSVFIAYVITILLLTAAISAEEAGLPILSAIAGFAIAKSPSQRNNNE